MDRKGEKRRQWDQESMRKALIDVQQNGMKKATAAKLHGIPRKTLTSNNVSVFNNLTIYSSNNGPRRKSLQVY